MSTTPTGNLALTVANLETLVANSASFQTACGITSGTAEEKIAAAKLKIYWPGQVLPNPVVRPFAMVKMKPGSELTGNDTGGAGFYPKLQLQLLLEIAATAGDDAKERLVKAWNFFGGVLQDMQDKAKTVGFLEVTSLTIDEGPLMSDPSEKDGYDNILIGVHLF